jgi:DNA-binding XRE family transcriptional regulator
MTTNTITLFPFGSGATTTPTVSKKRITGSSPIDIYVLSSDEELSVDDMFAQLESSDSRAVAATELGTKWVASTFFANRGNSLASLRMHAGLSQRALAEKLRVSQPLIAKWEKEKEPNMQLSTVKKLSAALSIELPELVKILANEN